MIDEKYFEYLKDFVTERRLITFDNVLAERTRHFTVALENIYQPHNASAVIRTCDVFGIQDVHIMENRYNFKPTNHVAKGAQKWLDIHYYNDKFKNTEDCVKALKLKGYQIIATTPHNDSCLLDDFDITKKSAFFFGVEKEGLSKELMDNADGFLKIPMAGFTESLNISVAAAIILQSVTAKLKKSDIKWQLSEDDKKEKKLEWVEKTIKSIKRIKEHYYKEKTI